MQQHELRPPRGAKKQRKRIGRGNASGKGTYAGKGMKGQQARSGAKVRPGFEGGQTPLIRRLPRRRGFQNPFRVEYEPVNLRDLARLPAGSEVTPEALRAAGVVRSASKPVKLLANGEIETAVTVRTHRVSAAARAKIEAAGGTVEELTPRPGPEQRRRRKAAEKKREQPAAQQDGEQPKDEGTSQESDEQESDGSGSETGESPTAS